MNEKVAAHGVSTQRITHETSTTGRKHLDGEQMSVLLACGSSVFTLGLVSILEADKRVGAIRVEENLDRVINRVATIARPVVVLPDSMGYDDLLSLRAARKDVGLLVLAASGSSLLAALLSALGVRVVLPNMTAGEVRAELLRASLASLLTERELEVYEQLRGSKSRNAAIAQTLGISVETVRAHAKSIYRKLGIRGRSELI